MEISYISIVTGKVIRPSTYWMMQAARYNEHTTTSEKEEFLAMYGVSALRVWIAMNPETEWKEQNAAIVEGPVIEPQPIVSDPFLSSIQPVLEQPAFEPSEIPVAFQENALHQKRKGILGAISLPFSRKKREAVVESTEAADKIMADERAEPIMETLLPVLDATVDQRSNELPAQTHAETDHELPPAPSLRVLDDRIIPMPPTRPKAVQSVPAPPARPRTVGENPTPPLRPKSTAEVAKPGVTTPGTAAKNYSKEDLWRMAKSDPYYDETATEDNGVVIRESRFNIKLVLVVVVCLIVVVGGAIAIALILSR